jgi:predicted protein tyrosine phosphatase
MTHNSNANEILPGLWLGNKAASEDLEWQKAHKITVVFNATKTLPFVNKEAKQYRIPVDDNLEPREIDNMSSWAAEATYKVVHEYKVGNNILIHCHAGMQRSAALMAMVLIALTQKPHEQVISYIREKRPVAFFPYINFKKSILSFEDEFQKAVSK